MNNTAGEPADQASVSLDAAAAVAVTDESKQTHDVELGLSESPTRQQTARTSSRPRSRSRSSTMARGSRREGTNDRSGLHADRSSSHLGSSVPAGGAAASSDAVPKPLPALEPSSPDQLDEVAASTPLLHRDHAAAPGDQPSAAAGQRQRPRRGVLSSVVADLDAATSFFTPDATTVHEACSWRSWRHSLLQTPMYLIRYLTALCYLAYDCVFASRVQEADVLRLLTDTSLSVMLHVASSDTPGTAPRYRFVYDDCRLVFPDARRYTHVGCSFTSDSILSFDVVFVNADADADNVGDDDPPGATVLSIDNFEQMYSLLYSLLAFGIHPKTHVLGERAAVQVLQSDAMLATLEPTTWSVLSLHPSFLRSWWSPISRLSLYECPTKQSIWHEIRNVETMRHRFFQHFREIIDVSPYLRFMARARSACEMRYRSHCRDNGIARHSLEPIFNAVCVHGPDHAAAWRTTRHLWFSMHPGRRSFLHCCRASLFNSVMVQPLLNPLVNNRIARLQGSVYRAIYDDIRSVDPYLADACTASVMN